VLVAEVARAPSFEVRSMKTLFEGPWFAANNDNRLYDVSPDDQRFLMLDSRGSGDDTTPEEVIVVDNFFEVLKRAVRR
jgi:hypothetical protein